MKKATTRTTIVIVFLILLMVGYYAYLSNKSRADRADANMTAVQSALSRDLTKDYPSTPKEVVKYYNEIMKCLYNEESTDEEIESLAMKARELYDDELLAANESGPYLIRLQEEVADYRKSERRITSCSVASSTNVEFFEQDGYSFARIMCGYNIMQGGKNYPSSQMYLLRKDANKRWKIYGWKDVEDLQEQAD